MRHNCLLPTPSAPAGLRAPFLPNRRQSIIVHLSTARCLLRPSRSSLQLMFKLRKELGDEDFKRIFEDPRVKGPKFDWQ